MKRILAAVIAAVALSNVAVAQSNDAAMQTEQRQAYDFLVKYSPL